MNTDKTTLIDSLKVIFTPENAKKVLELLGPNGEHWVQHSITCSCYFRYGNRRCILTRTFPLPLEKYAQTLS